MSHTQSPSSPVVILKNLKLADMSCGIAAADIVQDAAIVISGETIVWAGAAAQLPAQFASRGAINCQGQWALPGFIDCHTHLVFGGNRADEFEQRLQGVSYEDIARQGGGIRNTVTATRAATPKELLRLALQRAEVMLQQGVTTLEVKSGYGLDTETELKMLRVARDIAQHSPQNIKSTFLGAHALPEEYANKADDYIELVCQQMLPQVCAEHLADAVDVFCENIGFSLAQSQRVLDTAKTLNLPVKAHVEQLSNLGGSEMAANLDALSVDHIEFLDEAGVSAIAKSGTVATLLPGAFYFLRETQKPPVALLRQYNVPMAVATDFNPGSSPIASLPLMLNMACTFFGLTPEEALLGVTKYAAQALGLQDTLGTLEAGKQADICFWDIGHPRELCYSVGVHQPTSVWHKGLKVRQMGYIGDH